MGRKRISFNRPRSLSRRAGAKDAKDAKKAKLEQEATEVTEKEIKFPPFSVISC
jgi:hypothetical protein